MTCCFGCCDAIFPSNVPQRLLGGTTLMIFGSLGLLVAQLSYKNREEQEGETEHGKVTAYTGIVACTLVTALSVSAFVIHFLCIRRIRRLKKSAQAQGITDRQQNEEREETLWEWFFYPERETIPAARQAKITRETQMVYRGLSWNSSSRILLLAPSVALFALLVVRLFWGANNFDGLPYFLDFGWKYGLLPHDRNVFDNGDKLFHEPAEKSTAFAPEFNSYGHAAQGFFSALLAFPVVSAPLLRSTFAAKWLRTLIHLAPFGLTIYPTYNLIKRSLKAASAFAGSSFANNAFEWATGFMVACAIGNLWTSCELYQRLSAKVDDDSNRTEQQYQFQKPGFCVKIVQVLLGTVFLFTVFTAAILMGLTWHGCLKGSPDECVNYSEDGDKASSGIFATFLVIPLGLLAGVLVMECRKRR